MNIIVAGKTGVGKSKEPDELNKDEEVFCKGIGREFISLLENTSMSKVYKMPVHFLLESGKGFFVKKMVRQSDLEKS